MWYCKCLLFYFLIFLFQIRAKRSESPSKHRVNFEKWNKLTGGRRNVLLSSSVSEMPVSTDFGWNSCNVNNRKIKEMMVRIGSIRHLIISTLMKRELSSRSHFVQLQYWSILFQKWYYNYKFGSENGPNFLLIGWEGSIWLSSTRMNSNIQVLRTSNTCRMRILHGWRMRKKSELIYSSLSIDIMERANWGED